MSFVIEWTGAQLLCVHLGSVASPAGICDALHRVLSAIHVGVVSCNIMVIPAAVKATLGFRKC